MKTIIERIKSRSLRIRRNPDMTPTMVSLSLDDIAEALEALDERLAKLEAAKADPPYARRAVTIPADADWKVGAKF